MIHKEPLVMANHLALVVDEAPSIAREHASSLDCVQVSPRVNPVLTCHGFVLE